MKKISVIASCYNEETTVENVYKVISGLFENELKDYLYELIFVDDFSSDNTRDLIRKVCKNDPIHCKAIFNAANFGFSRNVFSAIQQGTDSDATFLFFADMQDPPELLPEFVKQWEEGKKVVIGRKLDSTEGWFITKLRKAYYNVIDLLAETKQISSFNGFGLYDKSFIEVLRQIGDIKPYLKSIVAEYATDYGTVFYHHRDSERKSSFSFYKNYDLAMEGITSSTKKLMRLSTFLGCGLGLISIIYAIYVIIRKLVNWNSFPVGMASLIVGVFLIGGVILFFIGVLGEYVMSINLKTTNKPRVVIGEKINYE